jgi:polysaccharide export outer membrane protein
MTFKAAVLLATLVWLGLTSCKLSSPPPRAIPFAEGGARPTPSVAGAVGLGYRVAVGDTLDIFVLEDDEMNNELSVRSSGDIILPKIGRVSVVGLTLSEVEKALVAKLEKDILKKATVIVDPVRRGGATTAGGSAASLTVFLNGNLIKTGRMEIPFVGNSQVTAMQAVADGGGFAPFANRKKSAILRRLEGGRTLRIPVDFAAIERGEATDPVLQHGDMIVVPQKLFGF